MMPKYAIFAMVRNTSPVTTAKEPAFNRDSSIGTCQLRYAALRNYYTNSSNLFIVLYIIQTFTRRFHGLGFRRRDPRRGAQLPVLNCLISASGIRTIQRRGSVITSFLSRRVFQIYRRREEHLRNQQAVEEQRRSTQRPKHRKLR